MIQNILHIYNEVFDAEGNVKNCGREICKDLIFLCQKHEKGNTDFGNIDTGMMNVENIKAYVKKNIIL